MEIVQECMFGIRPVEMSLADGNGRLVRTEQGHSCVQISPTDRVGQKELETSCKPLPVTMAKAYIGPKPLY